MASKNDPQYYVYYVPDTGDIIGVTHAPDESRTYLPVDYALACNFFAGTDHYSKYIVSLVKKKGKQVLAVVERQLINYSPRLRTFNRICESATNQEMIVEWNLPSKEWIVSLHTSNLGNVSANVIFYLVNEANFDQIIRTITVKLDDLVEHQSIHIPFESAAEEDITHLIVLSKLVLASYGLKITHE